MYYDELEESVWKKKGLSFLFTVVYSCLSNKSACIFIFHWVPMKLCS